MPRPMRSGPGPHRSRPSRTCTGSPRCPNSGLALGVDLGRSPVTLKILLENALRHAGGGIVREDDVAALAAWRPGGAGEAEIPFMPARVVLQDFTGVPAVVDLAAMRDAMADLGGDPAKVNPLVPADLVIDHSVQVDAWGGAGAFAINVEREYERNGERYQLLRWAQTAFRDLRVVPPGTGIIHQVNLEYLATVVTDREDDDGRVAYPDTLVGTDSHTTMVNGLGVLGYGVGGIEAEAVLLGQPLYQPMPRIVGVRLTGELPTRVDGDRPGAGDHARCCARSAWSARSSSSRATGLAGLSLADRATISNMSPEFGATATLFPIDDETLSYLRLTGRAPARVDLVERYAKAQGLWREPGNGPEFDVALELDLATVEPSLAGPRRPQDRVALAALGDNFRAAFPQTEGIAARSIPGAGDAPPFGHGVGGDRRHHVVHEHVQPDGDGRRRACWPATPSPAACTSRPRSRPRSRPARKAVTGYLEKADLHAAAGGARLLARRLRLHDLHRQLAARSPSRSATAIESDELDRRGGPVGQPQLRGAHPPAGAGVVPRLAAAGRRVRPGRAGSTST